LLNVLVTNIVCDPGRGGEAFPGARLGVNTAGLVSPLDRFHRTLDNRRSISEPASTSGKQDCHFRPDGGTVPQTVVTDGRQPMFQSMRLASLHRARSRFRRLWTSVHCHLHTSLRRRR